MKILISGSSGLIGTALTDFLQAEGFEVGRLLRQKQDKHPYWIPNNSTFHLKTYSNPDIIINLAGTSIANGRWTEKKKQQLITSRIHTTTGLVNHFKDSPPKLFINASAIGFYGERGEEILNENSDAGADFVSDLAAKWEQSCEAIQSEKTRLVKLRTGIVLSKNGGALSKMLPAFKLGLGGKIGSGKQFMSWIDINDVCRAILYIIQTSTLSGPVNITSPNPVSNDVFSLALSKHLHRPCFLPLPSQMVKLLFGEMGKELLLSSTQVEPQKLIDAGFKFECELLQDSLRNQLN